MNKQDATTNHHAKQTSTAPRFSSRQVESIAGLCAGFATTIITHPLDIIKIRLQLSNTAAHHNGTTSSKPFQSVLYIIRQINHDARYQAQKQQQRNPRGASFLRKSVGVNYLIQYYRGITPNLIGNISAWGCYFALYAEFKNHIHTLNLTINYFASSSMAGILTSILTNPIWVLKTRIIAKPTNEAGAYKSISDGIRTMVRNEGVTSFWKGSIPSMFQVFQASLQITIYDHLKNYIFKNRLVSSGQKLDFGALEGGDGNGVVASHLSTTQYLYTSALSKIISTLVMYPTQVIKSRLQNSHQSSTTILQVTRNLYFNEGGLRAFYKGLSANIVRVVPATCITFVVYEHVKRILTE